MKNTVRRLKIFTNNPSNYCYLEDEVNEWIRDNIDNNINWEIISQDQTQAIGGSEAIFGTSITIYIWYRRPYTDPID